MNSIASVQMVECVLVNGGESREMQRVANSWVSRLESISAAVHELVALHPVFRADGLSDDLLFVDVWPTGAEMAEDLSLRRKARLYMPVVFDEIMQCDSAKNFAKLTINGPAAAIGASADSEQALVSMADCSLLPDKNVPEAIAAITRWAEYLTKNASGPSHAVLFPTAGERPDASYNFLWVVGYESYAAYGQDFDEFGRGGGLRTYDALFEPLISCTSPQVFEAAALGSFTP